MVTKHQLTKKLHPIEDVFLTNLKNRWFEEPQKLCNLKQYLAVAQEWFQSTTLNNIQGWNNARSRHSRYLNKYYA